MLTVTLVTGFYSSGKTALVAHVLRDRNGSRIAVLPYESGPPEDLVAKVYEFAARSTHDHLLIEAAGHRDPASIAAAFSECVIHVAEAVRFDTIVTVVDAEALIEKFSSQELLEDGRSVADLLTEQIEFADVIVLNKADRISPQGRHGVMALVFALNPSASVIESVFGRVAAKDVLGTRRFNFGRAMGMAGWAKAFAGEHNPRATLFGISSMRYEARRPFHPERLARFFGSTWPGVVRSKGFFWLATRMDWVGELSQAGAARRYRPVSSWWAATLQGKSFQPFQVEEFLGIAWDPVFGDRRQDLVFIGINLNAAAHRMRLDSCLLTDAEFRNGQEAWQMYTDPFPSWGRAAAATRRVADYH